MIVEYCGIATLSPASKAGYSEDKLNCAYGVVSTAFIAFTVFSSSVPARAALITYNDRSVFNTAAPGLTTETFESGLVSAGAATPCNGPLNSSTTTACFAAGALLPGVTYDASGAGPLNMVVLGAGGG